MKKIYQTFNIIQADEWSRMIHSTYNSEEEAEEWLQNIYNTQYYIKDMYTHFFIEEEE